MLASAVAYAVAGLQGVRGQRAIENDQTLHDASNPTPVKVLPNRAARGGFSSLFDRPVSIGDAELDLDTGKTEVMRVTQAERSDRYRTSRSLPFTLVGQNYAPVLIDDVTIRVIASRPPISGAILYKSPQGGGVDVETLGFDLDVDRSSARRVEPSGRLAENYFNATKITLKKDEPVPFLIDVRTRNCDCDFVLDLHLADGRVQTIENDGEPWRTSAFAKRYSRSFGYDINADPPAVVPCQWPQSCESF